MKILTNKRYRELIDCELDKKILESDYKYLKIENNILKKVKKKKMENMLKDYDKAILVKKVENCYGYATEVYTDGIKLENLKSVEFEHIAGNFPELIIRK